MSDIAQDKPKRQKEKPIRTRFSYGEIRDKLSDSMPNIRASRKPAKEILKKTGRPTKFNETIADQLCDLISEGHPMTDACQAVGIDFRTLGRWQEKSAPFALKIARARVLMAEHAFAMAANVPRDLYERAQSGEVIDNATVSAARLYAESLRWYAEKLNPARYGHKTQASVEVSGPGGGPIQTASLVIDARTLSPEHRDVLRNAILSARPDDTEIESDKLSHDNVTHDDDG
jgi:hypothetical protein